jgi:metallo-beta-lactamase class B
MKSLAMVVTPMLFVAMARAEPTSITLSHLRGNVYVMIDTYPLSDENSAVYIGAKYVTVVGATFSPETAKALAGEVAKVTDKPIREVIDTNYNLDRAGGNPYFRRIGAKIVSIDLTQQLLVQNWAQQVAGARARYPEYPDICI